MAAIVRGAVEAGSWCTNGFGSLSSRPFRRLDQQLMDLPPRHVVADRDGGRLDIVPGRRVQRCAFAKLVTAVESTRTLA